MFHNASWVKLPGIGNKRRGASAGSQRMKRMHARAALLGILWLCISAASCASAAEAGAAPSTGQEFKAKLTFQDKNVEVVGALFLPEIRHGVRALIVIIDWGMGSDTYQDPAWRDLAARLQAGMLLITLDNIRPQPEDIPVTQQLVRNSAAGGADALFAMLGQFARQANRRELAQVPMLFWGHSAAGSFGTTFAAAHPLRTIGFVRYNSHLRGLPVAIEAASRTPALLMAGGKDQVAGVTDAEALWRSGKTAAAPWTLAVVPDASHASAVWLARANALVIPWMASVVQARVSDEADGALRLLSAQSGWLGNRRTLEVSESTSNTGSPAEAIWLPDQASARAWQTLSSERIPNR